MRTYTYNFASNIVGFEDVRPPTDEERAAYLRADRIRVNGVLGLAPGGLEGDQDIRDPRPQLVDVARFIKEKTGHVPATIDVILVDDRKAIFPNPLLAPTLAAWWESVKSWRP